MFVFTVDESESCTRADPGFDPELQEKHNELPFAITPTAQGSSQSFLELLHAPVSPATSTQSTSSAKKVTVKKIKASPEAEIVQVQKEILLKLTELTTIHSRILKQLQRRNDLEAGKLHNESTEITGSQLFTFHQDDNDDINF